MDYTNYNTVQNLNIAYIGGGSRGWAWGLMSDLANAGDLSGEVRLYDIDPEAARNNEQIGNMYSTLPDCKSRWTYRAVPSLEAALTGADFVVISILPGTFDEMESDVHAPEKYGIYQSVGDTTGPGGILRALRTIPMIEVIGKAIRDHAPRAWVINYTNPMTLCVQTLYHVFPEIRAFGCCHEVFSTKKLLATALKEICGIENVARDDIKVNVVSVNHFTWLTAATWHNMDLFPVYREFAQRFGSSGYGELKTYFDNQQKVKLDLFRRFGYIAAAGDRHLAEFCPRSWYLGSPEQANSWGFTLTPVSWRKQDLRARLARSEALRSGAEPLTIRETGEDGVAQMRALLGLKDLITNVNLPNRGQIPNLPMGAVVETNAAFRDSALTPLLAGPIPASIYPLISRIVGLQAQVAEAAWERDLDKAFYAFINDPLMDLDVPTARKLFDEMVHNTKAYLKDYNV